MEIFSLKIGVDSTTGLPYGVFDWTGIGTKLFWVDSYGVDIVKERV
jgi:hypothetical protein